MNVKNALIKSAYSATNVQLSQTCHPNRKPVKHFKLGHGHKYFLRYDAVYSGKDIMRFRGNCFL